MTTAAAILTVAETRDVQFIAQWWRDHWHADFIICFGQKFYADDVEALISVDERGRCIGVATFQAQGGALFLVSLDATEQGAGVGSALITALAGAARERGLTIVRVSTSNDNLDALRFYQRRGFRLSAIRRGAVDEARLSKPSIPMVAANGIAIRDEIELELTL